MGVFVRGVVSPTCLQAIEVGVAGGEPTPRRGNWGATKNLKGSVAVITNVIVVATATFAVIVAVIVIAMVSHCHSHCHRGGHCHSHW